MNERQFKSLMKIVVTAMEERGYDPYTQLCGYLETGDPAYITRHKNARDIIVTLEKTRIRRYVVEMKK